MNKRMTEKQAWAELAIRASTNIDNHGLCVALCGPRFYELPYATRLRMEDRINKLPHPYGPVGDIKISSGEGWWVWPRTEKGNKQRAAYCRRQVKRLEREAAARAASRGRKKRKR